MRRAAWRLLSLPFIGAVAFFRDPSLLESPRFWAEEGSNYFQSAITRSVSAGLLHVAAAPHNPYLHPVPHLATLMAAHALPLELAPWATTAAWAVVLLAVELVALFGLAKILDPLPMRFLACLAPFLAVGSSENWANTLGAHFYCDVALLLLLLEAPCVEGARRAASVGAFAVFAFLSPTSFLLVPAALLLSLGQRRPHRPYVVVLGAVVLLATAIHFAVFPSGARAHPDRVAIPHLFLSKLLVWPLLGRDAANAYGVWASSLSRSAFLETALGVSAGLVTVVFGFWALSQRDTTTRALLATWLSSAAAYLLLGIDVGRAHLPAVNGGRYAFLPSILLILLLGHQLVTREPRARARRRTVFGLPLAATVLVGLSEYRYPEDVAEWIHGRPWRTEVAHFRETPGYDHLRIAPSTWVVVVPASAR